jgi:hypothetical protein
MKENSHGMLELPIDISDSTLLGTENHIHEMKIVNN